jgi:AcrR family transcriptional regulator
LNLISINQITGYTAGDRTNSMANVKNNSAAQETRRRLLSAAGEVFADHGYLLATIKEITDRAGASLASVNYHFQDKAALYAAVLRRLAEDSALVVPPDEELTGDPATRLRKFIRYVCLTMFGRTRQPWEQILMAREMADPTTALHPLYEHVVHPLSEKLSSLISELLDRPRSHPSVGLTAASVLGQCVYYMKHRSLIGRMHPQLGDSPDAEQLADHIAEFSLAGIRALRIKRKRSRVLQNARN